MGSSPRPHERNDHQLERSRTATSRTPSHGLGSPRRPLPVHQQPEKNLACKRSHAPCCADASKQKERAADDQDGGDKVRSPRGHNRRGNTRDMAHTGSPQAQQGEADPFDEPGPRANALCPSLTDQRSSHRRTLSLRPPTAPLPDGPPRRAGCPGNPPGAPPCR